MLFEYGKRLQLKKDTQLKFYVDGIYPSGQLGYKEPHYKILFDDASMIMSESLASTLFELVDTKKPEKKQIKEDHQLDKLNKDDLIAIAAQIDSSSDLTKLKKSELINFIEGNKNA
ncbi:MAG: hypothetical protein VW397_09280 [Candidatus Margulisiibacteriota bacterium]